MLPTRDAIVMARTDDDGSEHRTAPMIIMKAAPREGAIHLEGKTVEALFEDAPLPFDPPGIEAATDPAGFNYWWRQICWVFDLPDPCGIPPLPHALDDDAARVVNRFVLVATSLASSALLNSSARFDVAIDDVTREPTVRTQDPPLDAQAGFGALLRQCMSNDDAAFRRVHNILKAACSDAADDERDTRLEALKRWSKLVVRLEGDSLNQLLRNALVQREGWQAFNYQEAESPKDLLRTFNYGDLVHWGTQKDAVKADRIGSAEQRMAFFKAAAGLTHALVGYSEVARSLCPS